MTDPQMARYRAENDELWTLLRFLAPHLSEKVVTDAQRVMKASTNPLAQSASEILTETMRSAWAAAVAIDPALRAGMWGKGVSDD